MGRLYNFIGFALDSYWSAPLQIIIAIVLLVRLLGGYPLLAGLGVLIVSVPLTFLNGKVIAIVQKQKMQVRRKIQFRFEVQYEAVAYEGTHTTD